MATKIRDLDLAKGDLVRRGERVYRVEQVGQISFNRPFDKHAAEVTNLETGSRHLLYGEDEVEVVS